MMKRRTGQTGYSLIELLVVVALIGIVSLVTVPNFISMYRASKIKGAIRQFTSDIRNARQVAVTENSRIMVSLGTTADERSRYWMYREVDGNWELFGPDGKTLEEATERTTVYFSATDFGDTVTTDGKSRADIIFQRNGTVRPFPTVGSGQYPAISIKTDDDVPISEYTVRVSAAGTVKVEKVE
ncbi:MAG TPA: type II secretion system protein [Rhodothermales bacterium]|nr:type II secretion system protein [Rhodothermales bacterium]